MTIFSFFFFLNKFGRSATYVLGEKYGGAHYKPPTTSGTVLIQQTIYQSFHNIKGEIGGCIYVHDDTVTTIFNSVGFSDCFTRKEGGAINILSHTIKISNTCAFQCEAIGSSYQFAKLESNVEHEENRISFLTVVSCGANNKGLSAIGLCGAAKYYTTNMNSSNNINNFDGYSYGACFRTHGIVYHQTIGVNFLNSCGYDIFNTDFDKTKSLNSAFDNGNVYNCSTKYVFKFKGRTSISNFRFGKLTVSDGYFMCALSDKTAHSLTFASSRIDVNPITGIDSNVNIAGGCSLQNPIETVSINNIGLDYCPVPTQKFTKSLEFTKTTEFSASEKFSRSVEFSPFEKFSKSVEFSASEEFANLFDKSSSSYFTASNPFTPSFTFKPNATKYPDGYNGVHVSGIGGKKATPAQIGVTSGISILLIIIAVLLMLAYLRSKKKQLKGEVAELSDTFLKDTDDETYSYSYSYYTYEYYSTTERSESYSLESYTYTTAYSERSYSDFDASLFAQVD